MCPIVRGLDSGFAAIVLFCHATQLFFSFLVATLQLSHLPRLLVCKRVSLSVARTLTATLSLGLDFLELSASCSFLLLVSRSARCSSCLAFGVVLCAAVCASHQWLRLAVGVARGLAHGAALMSQSLSFIFSRSTTGG
jgi:hypothetical protein